MMKYVVRTIQVKTIYKHRSKVMNSFILSVTFGKLTSEKMSSNSRYISVNDLPLIRYVVKHLIVDGKLTGPTVPENSETDIHVKISENSWMVVSVLDHNIYELLESQRKFLVAVPK